MKAKMIRKICKCADCCDCQAAFKEQQHSEFDEWQKELIADDNRERLRSL